MRIAALEPLRPCDGDDWDWRAQERKMERTRERDRQAVATAESAGWTAVRVWEREVRADSAAVAAAVLEG